MSLASEALRNPNGAENLSETVEGLWDDAKMFEGTGWQQGNIRMSFEDGVAQFTTDYSTELGPSWNAALISRDEGGQTDLFTEILRPYAELQGGSKMIRRHYPVGSEGEVTEMVEVGYMREGTFHAEELIDGSTMSMAARQADALEFLKSVTPPAAAAA